MTGVRDLCATVFKYSDVIITCVHAFQAESHMLADADEGGVVEDC